MFIGKSSSTGRGAPHARAAHAAPSLRARCRVAARAAAVISWEGVRKDVVELISDPAEKGGIGEKGPTIVRLAWHSSGSYDKMSKTGGSRGGTIRFKEELMHGGNGGLDNPVKWLDAIKDKHPDASYADIYTFAGKAAVEAMGGPEIPWKPGRKDEMDPSTVTPDGRLPEPDSGNPTKTAADLRAVFGRMGFDDKELVCLSGAHALGRCHEDWSGYIGPWTPTPTMFSNLYFKLLLKGFEYWTPDERMPKFQFKDPTGELMMLPSDIVLIQDPELKKWVELYAKDRKLFYDDFAKAFGKLLALGCE
ncbi:hypothetical protein FOA52_004125 [Chlamydomonas sp. UWO 241]|nr:hypothetical protein FOA52_004125 [Chlamydomonas sp. UWO 241]